MGLEPTTFCMATRPGLQQRCSRVQRNRRLAEETRVGGCGTMHGMTPPRSLTLATRLQLAAISYWLAAHTWLAWASVQECPLARVKQEREARRRTPRSQSASPRSSAIESG